MHDIQRTIIKGYLRLFDEKTGKEILHKNMVLKNSSHVTALAFGQDINKITVKVGSWGDEYDESPSYSSYSMTELECLQDTHLTDANHTVSEFLTNGHSYPGSKAIRYSFKFDRNNSSELLDKNLLEWGLFFNDILFSRVALHEDFIFKNWMSVSGEWTIIFMSCSGGYSNYILNQYQIESLWGMDYVDANSFVIPDYVGRNDLIGYVVPPKLISNLSYIYPNVTDADKIHKDSLVSFYNDNNTYNILKINNSDIYQNGLNLNGPFTMWQWFMVKSVDFAPLLLENGKRWVLSSKWVDGDLSKSSYRLYLYRSEVDGTICLHFDINNNGTLVTLKSEPIDYNILSTINLLGSWCLSVAVYDSNKQKLSLYFNGIEEASVTLTNIVTPETTSAYMIGAEQSTTDSDNYNQDTIFKGFIDETGFSHDTFSNRAISLLWNNGYGDFFNL